MSRSHRYGLIAFYIHLSLTDRQTTDRLFSRNPDKIQTADRIETDRIRTDRHLTGNPDRIQTPDRIFRQIRTKTRHGQDTDSAVRRRLLSMWRIGHQQLRSCRQHKSNIRHCHRAFLLYLQPFQNGISIVLQRQMHFSFVYDVLSFKFLVISTEVGKKLPCTYLFAPSFGRNSCKVNLSPYSSVSWEKLVSFVPVQTSLDRYGFEAWLNVKTRSSVSFWTTLWSVMSGVIFGSNFWMWL